MDVRGSRICCLIAWWVLVGIVADLYTLYDRYDGNFVKIKYVVDEVGV